MKNPLILSIFTLLFSSAVFSATCELTASEEEKLLAMSYEEFDQSSAGVWREKAEKLHCYHESGVLIDKYVAANKNKLADWQVINTTWHAGQMYAFNNEYDIARERFTQSINPNEPKESPILWNDYVYASIAFLNHDLPKLKLHRDNIANGPVFNGIKMNLNIVDGLIKYIDLPYSEAYGK